MGFAKILVPVTGASTDQIALATAFAAAKPFGAHVAALFVHADPREVAPYIYSGAPLSEEVVQSIVDGQKQVADEAERAARSSFKNAAEAAYATTIPEPARHEGLSCSFQVRYGFISNLIVEAARFSDLVVFKPVSGDERPEFTNAIVGTLYHASRPVVLSPHKLQDSFARNIVIGWDGGDAAARAAAAAVPYLKQASNVEILRVFGSARSVPEGASALKAYLDIHGISASLSRISCGAKQSIGECLMEEAAKTGDLLVMGGYGHSHLRETFLGGVTLDVISHHTLPVFLAH